MMFRVLFVVLLCSKPLRTEIYSSVEHLTNAFKVERNVVDALSEYLTKTEEHLQHIRSYLHDYKQAEEESKLLERNNLLSQNTKIEIVEYLASNPLQAYQLVKRLTMSWKNLTEHDPVSKWNEIENILKRTENFDYSQLSKDVELNGVAQAIIVLQSIYKLNMTSLTSGNIAGIQSAAGLTAEDCLYLGKYSLQLEMYYNAILWLEQTLSLASLEDSKTVTEEDVISFLNEAYESYEGGSVVNLPQPQSQIKRRIKKMLKFKEDISKKSFHKGNPLNLVDVHWNYEALCRGEQLMSDSEVAKLKCFYDNRNSPYLVLMPAKTERHHRNPEILVFHDVITDNEILNLKFVINHEIASLDEDIEKEFFKKLGLRVDALTGLLTTSFGSSETFQIANYGIGGLYNPHVDFFNENEIIEVEDNEGKLTEFVAGDRIATFMFYLSDVKKGGATAFPKLGVSIFPQKGSAVLWYNLKKSGKGNDETFHGGCPVIHGSKWVANKWIKELNQMFIRPCSLSEEE